MGSDLYICVDCGMWIANGETPPEDDNDVNPWTPNLDAWVNDVVMGDADLDREFSWAHCDVCGSPLGGYRFHAVLLPN